jgi:hypothetical protein
MLTAIAPRKLRNVTELAKLSTQFVVIKPFVTYDDERSTFIDKLDNVMSLVGLTFDQSEADCASTPIGERHDFRIAAASRFAHLSRTTRFGGIASTLMDRNMASVYQPDSASRSFCQYLKYSAPQTVGSPAVVPSVNGLPRAKPLRQIAPRTSIAQAVEQGIENSTQIGTRSAHSLPYPGTTIFKSRFFSGSHHKNLIFIAL